MSSFILVVILFYHLSRLCAGVVGKLFGSCRDGHAAAIGIFKIGTGLRSRLEPVQP